MTILFAANEAQDLLAVGSPTITVQSGTTVRRSANTRVSFNVGVSAGNQIANYVMAELGSTYTNLWVTWRGYLASTTSTSGYPLLVFGRSGTKRVGVFGSGTTSKLCVGKIDASNSFTNLASETGTYSTATLYKFDLQIINYGASGTINLYRANSDGTGSSLIATYTGDLTTNSETALSQIFLGVSAPIASSGQGYFSELVVSTTDTRGMGLSTLAPAANGNAFQWSGSYTDVNDTATVDATFITANANNDLAQTTIDTSLLGTPSGIEAVIISHRSRAGATIPKVTPNLRLGGTDYFGTQITPAAGFTTYQEIFATNPNTSTAWVYTDLTAAGVNVGLRANT